MQANRKIKMKTSKYLIIGSEAQVAATESRSNLNLCRRLFRPAKFSNGCRALVAPLGATTKRDAAQLLHRSQTSLAFVSGRLGRWLTPTFCVVTAAELRSRMSAK